MAVLLYQASDIGKNPVDDGCRFIRVWLHLRPAVDGASWTQATRVWEAGTYDEPAFAPWVHSAVAKIFPSKDWVALEHVGATRLRAVITDQDALF